MILQVPATEVIAILPLVRQGKRRSINTHRTNVAEILRLLKPHGLTLGRRIKYWKHGRPSNEGTLLLRIDHARGRGWHWAVFHEGRVLDPLRPTPCGLGDYDTPISWYEVQER